MAAVDGLHASLQTPESVASAEYWRRVCGHLHVDDANFQKQEAPGREVASADACADVRDRLIEEGYAALPPSSLRWRVPVAALREGILALERHGWPATFIIMFDEAWVMNQDVADIMSKATGNTPCMDTVGFHVDPRRQASTGFSPHRDRQPEDWTPKGVPSAVSATFKDDGMAKYVTLWCALTDACPDNSCLHFIPKSCDPGYAAGDPDEGDPMRRCFMENAQFRNIRCAPMAAGGCTFHTHRTIHWGNAGRASYAGGPRIALSFGCSTSDFEPPYFSPKSLPFPTVRLRAALAAAQVLNYATLSNTDTKGWAALAGSMASCSSSTFRLLHRVFCRSAKAFHKTYRKEIGQKFVNVTLSMGSSSTSKATGGDAARTDHVPGALAEKATEDAGDYQDSDDDDDALKALLNVEAVSGEVLFHDDFDMLNCGEALPAKKRSKRGRLTNAARKRPRRTK